MLEFNPEIWDKNSEFTDFMIDSSEVHLYKNFLSGRSIDPNGILIWTKDNVLNKAGQKLLLKYDTDVDLALYTYDPPKYAVVVNLDEKFE